MRILTSSKLHTFSLCFSCWMISQRDTEVKYADSGWQTKATFEYIMRTIVFPGIVDWRKKTTGIKARSLLMIDSHSSRLKRELWKEAAQMNIDVITYKSHSSHLCQPLDCLPFAIFKQKLKENFINPVNSSIKSYRFAMVSALIAGFHACTEASVIKKDDDEEEEEEEDEEEIQNEEEKEERLGGGEEGEDQIEEINEEIVKEESQIMQ
ncbi:MAG: hypothetical protein EZS28_034205 [Streblomastix strix]|uniref:DDE-1 domain-containing protein n=1 Tax=Streblomastix strix TaxID=222440 RepID=A0A5J4UHT5_9EUKA|nr:MAG: hypothetical protein EZS28_034205 [Streblomastix strix]